MIDNLMEFRITVQILQSKSKTNITIQFYVHLPEICFTFLPEW